MPATVSASGTPSLTPQGTGIHRRAPFLPFQGLAASPSPPTSPLQGWALLRASCPLGGLEQRCAWAVKPAPFCPSGVVPEDQAQYVCEAQNMFGKVRAEAQLVVTGHGSLVELGEEGLGGDRGPWGGPPYGCPPLWNRCAPAQFSKRSLWTPPSCAACPRKCTLDLRIPYPDAPTGSLGRSGGAVGPLSPR